MGYMKTFLGEMWLHDVPDEYFLWVFDLCGSHLQAVRSFGALIRKAEKAFPRLENFKKTILAEICSPIFEFNALDCCILMFLEQRLEKRNNYITASFEVNVIWSISVGAVLFIMRHTVQPAQVLRRDWCIVTGFAPSSCHFNSSALEVTCFSFGMFLP